MQTLLDEVSHLYHCSVPAFLPPSDFRNPRALCLSEIHCSNALPFLHPRMLIMFTNIVFEHAINPRVLNILADPSY